MTTVASELTGEEQPSGNGVQLDATLLDFWRWRFRNLLFNDVRGVYGERLVAQLLEIAPPPRDSWAAYDLMTPEGVRVEVKTTAFLQAWNPTASTKKPVFSGLKGQAWTLETGYSGIATYNADLYVFCLQIEQDITRWNALDLAQWRFFLLPKATVEQRNCQSISLSALRKCTRELTACEFMQEARAMITLISERL